MQAIETATRAAEAVPARSLEEYRAELSALSDEQLVKVVCEGLRLQDEHLKRLGAAVVLCQERGIKLVGVEPSLVRFYARIGRGEVLPEAVRQFAGRPVTLLKIIKRPIEEQAELLKQPIRDVEESFRTRPRGRGSLRTPDSHGPLTVPALSNLLSSATAHDAADLCLEIVTGHPAAAEVAARLVARLVELYPAARPLPANGKARRPQAVAG